MNRQQRRQQARNGKSTLAQPKVCVATLYATQAPPVGEFFDAWSNLLTARPVDIVEVVTVSGSLVADARNLIVRRFLASPAEWLFTVDSDMDFTLDAVPRLLAHADATDRPIVGALCFKVHRSGEVEPTLYQLEAEPHEFLRVQRDWVRGELVQVAATGAACMVIHRSVFEKLSGPWFGPGSLCGEELGEDVTFCLAAGNAGLPVCVATDVAVGHVKPKSYGVADWERQRAELARIPTFVIVPVRDAEDPIPVRGAPVGIEGVYAIPNDGPVNIPRSWNKGMAYARAVAHDMGASEWNLLFLNDDVVLDTERVVAQLSAGLRADPSNALAYPNWHGFEGSGVVATRTDDPGGLTFSGWAFMLRGESAVAFDERFPWHYSDNDYERRIHVSGRRVVCVLDCHVDHLRPNEATISDPDLVAQAVKDEATFASKWGVDSAMLFWAQHPELVDGAGHVRKTELARDAGSF